MPILLPEDMNFPLPKMHRVKQVFPRNSLDNIEAAVRAQICKPAIQTRIAPGARVAVAVGSRGIQNLAEIVKTTLECVQAAGGEPFIIAAMGSHGGGTSEGQRQVLAGYGITEKTMGVPVVTSMEVTLLGQTSQGVDIHFDSAALGADLIIPINRVKMHTDFVAPLQSGLCKMLAIGLANHIGCTAMHEHGFEAFGEILPVAADIILREAPVGFGIAIIENAYDETAIIEAVPAELLIEREKELLKISQDNMALLMMPEIDVLIVEEIGKDISGAGFDPNILGKSFLLKEFMLPVPRIRRMVLNSISEKSQGNGLGMGVFDVITRKVFEQLDFESTYANAIAAKCTDDAKIPIIAPDEDQVLRVAIKILEGSNRENLKIVKIKNTLALDVIEVSDALLPHVRTHDKLELLQ